MVRCYYIYWHLAASIYAGEKAMTERFVSPFARFFTSDLKTLPGAKLYFYENGTTTPKTIYQDPFKTNAHANPVLAGSLGYAADTFPPIFLDGTYTVELQNSAGVVQAGWPVNNVGGEQIEGQLDNYSPITAYSIGQLVTGSDGNRYESTANNNLNRDPTNPANRTAYWKQVFIIGEYVSTEAYGLGDYVTHDGGLFKNVQAGAGNNPNTAHAYWVRMHNIPHWGSTVTFRHYDLVIDSNGVVQVSQQNANLNHNPVGDSGTWWLPYWATIPNTNTVLVLTGGGNLTARYAHELTDSSTYTLPAANSVPANTVLYAFTTDKNRTSTPIVQRAGSDLIEWSGGTDTSFRFNFGYSRAKKFTTNGVDRWRF